MKRMSPSIDIKRELGMITVHTNMETALHFISSQQKQYSK